MKSFSFIGAIALAAGVSAQYSASPVPTSIPGGCNPAHPGSCPSSYFQTMSKPAATSVMSAASGSASKPASNAPAPSVSTTITAHAGCPTGPAADVLVTRTGVPVPSCEAGKNATKPSIISMPGYGLGSGNGTKATGTSSGNLPEFTGAAGRNAVSGALVVLGGVAAYLL